MPPFRSQTAPMDPTRIQTERESTRMAMAIRQAAEDVERLRERMAALRAERIARSA